MHFDLRLEMGGVLKSWCIPKGPTLGPGVKRLAVEVEDHPLDYANFNGTIPEGQYGAGRSLIWDKGRVEFYEAYPLEAWERGRISFKLEGKKLHGEFALIRMKGRKGKPQWLLIKKDDEFAEPGWQPDLLEPDERFKPDGQEPKPVKSRRSSKSKATGRSKQTRRRKATETSGTETISVATFLKRERLEGNLNLKIGKHIVELT